MLIIYDFIVLFFECKKFIILDALLNKYLVVFTKSAPRAPLALWLCDCVHGTHVCASTVHVNIQFVWLSGNHIYL